MKTTQKAAEKKSRRRRLQTQDDVRRALAWVATELEREGMEVPRARAMTHALGTLSSVMERTQIEERMDALQAELQTLQAAAVRS
jgi:hypothetical protein